MVCKKGLYGLRPLQLPINCIAFLLNLCVFVSTANASKMICNEDLICEEECCQSLELGLPYCCSKFQGFIYLGLMVGGGVIIAILVVACYLFMRRSERELEAAARLEEAKAVSRGFNNNSQSQTMNTNLDDEVQDMNQPPPAYNEVMRTFVRCQSCDVNITAHTCGPDFHGGHYPGCRSVQGGGGEESGNETIITRQHSDGVLVLTGNQQRRILHEVGQSYSPCGGLPALVNIPNFLAQHHRENFALQSSARQEQFTQQNSYVYRPMLPPPVTGSEIWDKLPVQEVSTNMEPAIEPAEKPVRDQEEVQRYLNNFTGIDTTEMNEVYPREINKENSTDDEICRERELEGDGNDKFDDSTGLNEQVTMNHSYTTQQSQRHGETQQLEPKGKDNWHESEIDPETVLNDGIISKNELNGDKYDHKHVTATNNDNSPPLGEDSCQNDKQLHVERERGNFKEPENEFVPKDPENDMYISAREIQVDGHEEYVSTTVEVISNYVHDSEIKDFGTEIKTETGEEVIAKKDKPCFSDKNSLQSDDKWHVTEHLDHDGNYEDTQDQNKKIVHMMPKDEQHLKTPSLELVGKPCNDFTGTSDPKESEELNQTETPGKYALAGNGSETSVENMETSVDCTEETMTERTETCESTEIRSDKLKEFDA